MGLGNPGAGYATTRHNAGYLLADALAARWQLSRFRRGWGWRARVAKGEVGGVPVMVVKPTTYMNRSGQALSPLLSRTDVDPANDLLVLVDDVALPLGRFRLRARGSAGGHNGLRSIAGRLGSETYPRMRIGVGPRPADVDGADYVLSHFESHELESLTQLMPTLIEAVECWVAEGTETAMNRYNRRGTESE